MISLSCDEICSAISACAPELTASNSGCAWWLDQESTKVHFISPPCALRFILTDTSTDLSGQREGEKKVGLCYLLINYIADHVGRKQLLHTSPPPSEPEHCKFCCRPKLWPTGTSASTPTGVGEVLFSGISNFLIQCVSMGFDPNRRRLNVVVLFFVLYIKWDRMKTLCFELNEIKQIEPNQMKLNENIVFYIDLLLLGLIWSNVIFKSLSFFYSYWQTLSLETVRHGSTCKDGFLAGIHHWNWPQKPYILEITLQTNRKDSLLAWETTRLQLQNHPYPQKEQHPSWCPILTQWWWMWNRR